MEGTLLVLLLCLGTIAAILDIREGIIPNKMLLFFTGCALILDAVYYGVLAADMAGIFILNVLVVTLSALGLYFTHTIAGGDCKLLPVISLLYPAGMYLTYNRNSVTLIVALFFAIFYGYLYILGMAVWKIITGETKINKSYISESVKAYLRSYIKAMIYIMFVNMSCASLIKMGLRIDDWIVLAVCITVAWFSGRTRVLKSHLTLIIISVADIVLSLCLKILPVSLNPRTYIFSAVLLLCQMAIKTNIYEKIPVARVKKGMILSSFSSLMMQSSKIEGLPGISSEDLRNRLTEEEAESIKRWSKSTKGLKEVVVVKKIPFAVFIAMGYISYFVLWSVVR